jgi:hypothetical protein
MRGKGCEMIEEPCTVTEAKIELKLDGPPPKKVTLAPECKTLPFEVKEGYVRVDVPAFKGYAMVVFE